MKLYGNLFFAIGSPLMIEILRFSISGPCLIPLLPPILFSLQINSIGCMFLQVAFFTYTRLQLSLTRETAAVSSLVEQLVDVIFKELDQSSMTSSGSLR